MPNSRRLIIALLLVAIFLISCDQMYRYKFEDTVNYINVMNKPVNYKDISAKPDTVPAPSKMTVAEAKVDFQHLEYLFETAYAGYGYFGKQNITWKEYFDRIDNWLSNQKDTVTVLEFEKQITDQLERLNDASLTISGRQYHSFFKRTEPYFADVLLEKKGEKYIVIASEDETVKIGDELKWPYAEEVIFPTLSPPGKEHFLVGKMSETYYPYLNCTFGENKLNLKLHKCRLSDLDNNKCNVLIKKEYAGVPYVKVSSFSDSNKQEMQDLKNYARELNKKSFFIMDISGNAGGSDVYPYRFMQYLNSFAYRNITNAELHSPAIAQSWVSESVQNKPTDFAQKIQDYKKEHETLRKKPMRKWLLGNSSYDRGGYPYSGEMVLFVNRFVAGAAEEMVHTSRGLEKATIIGENTAGNSIFINPRKYYLPNSQIELTLPSELKLIEGYSGEGKGFMPDIWLDSYEPVQEILKWMKKNKDYAVALNSSNFDDIEFENWTADSMPVGFRVSRFGDCPNDSTFKMSVVKPDSKNEKYGDYCLYLDSDKDTDAWHILKKDLPEAHGKVKLTFYAMWKNIESKGYFKKCYVGLNYRDESGRNNIKVKQIKKTDRTWRKYTIELDFGKNKIHDAQLEIFKTAPGELWVDRITFEVEKPKTEEVKEAKKE